MKLNLIYGEGEVFNGYLNLNPFVENETENIKRCDIKNISPFIDDGEADEIICIGVLDFFPVNKISEILTGWIKKIKIGGKIIIGFIDSYELTRNLSYGSINMETFNALVHGNGSKPYSVKRCSLSTKQIKSLLSSLNCKISQHKINNFNITIEAIRQ